MTPEQHEQVGRCIFREAYDAFVIVTPDDLRVRDVNPAVQRLTGARRKQLLDRVITDLIEAETPARLEVALSACRTTSCLAARDGYLLKTATGDAIPIHLTVSRIHTEPDPLALLILRDLTAQKRAEEALHQGAARLAEAQRVGQVGSWELDLATGRAVWSDEGFRRLGLEPGATTPDQETFHRCVHPDDRAAVAEYLSQAVRARTELDHEFRVVWADGTVRWLHSRGRVVADATGRPLRFVGVSLDVTERKQAEETRLKLEAQMQQAQRLEALGVMAGGIAHDFNNLLTAILGHADLALLELAPAATARYSVEQVAVGARRAAELANQMLIYAGKGRAALQPVTLPDLVRDLTELLKVSVSKKALLQCHLATDLPPVEADPAQLRQVLMNLIINASDALGERDGAITVRAAAGRGAHGGAFVGYRSRDLPAGECVLLEVADTGCGMEPGVLAKIFDPFFTTKFAGRGLGLAAVLGIVHNHGGAIEVASTPGRGTTFRVFLPTARGSVTRAVEPDDDWRGTGTALVIDDEDAVRGLAERMLRELGFAALTARNGCEGIEVYRAHAGHVAVVLLDLTMPGLDGVETLRELRRIRPDVRVVFSSGYGEQEALLRLGADLPAAFVAKPFGLNDFRRTLRRVLEPNRITAETPRFPSASPTAPEPARPGGPSPA